MASSDTVKECSLRELLDRFVDAQRRDIYTYCGGHLNESRLYRPLDSAPYAKWSKSAHLQMSSKHSVGDESTEKVICTKRDVYPADSLDTSGVTSPEPDLKGTSSCTQPRHSSTSSSNQVKSPRLLSPLAKTLDERISGKQFASSVDIQTSRNVPQSTDLKPFNIHSSIGLTAVTKRDQFTRMKSFETNILKSSGGMQKSVLSGMQAVDILQRRLEQNLKELTLLDKGPSYHRLQVYADIFEELADSSPTFHYILRQIKNTYDAYVASLLDSQSDGHSALQSDIARFTICHTDVEPRLNAEMDKVSALEQRAKLLLGKNESLRLELAKETELASQSPPEVTVQPPLLPVEVEPSEHIERLRTAILEKLDAIQELRAHLRTDCVPSSVYTYLKQCLKDADVEIQRLVSQKEYFEQSIAKLEGDLIEAVESADTTEQDAKRIWKRIELIRSDNVISGGGIQDLEQLDDDDSAKWCWYIS